MSELREEAAIAREALVRDKKKTKQQTTLLTKWNIVLDYGESGVGMAEFCAEYNDRQGKAVGVVLEESKHLKAPPPEHLIHLHELLDANGVASRFTTLA